MKCFSTSIRQGDATYKNRHVVDEEEENVYMCTNEIERAFVESH